MPPPGTVGGGLPAPATPMATGAARWGEGTSGREPAAAQTRRAGHEADQRSAVAQPGLAVVDVAACDEQTAFAVQELLAGRAGCAAALLSRRP
ncbi:DUF6207 family protein [Streptomyces griseoaurantiacus]|uniref:DUF6207 family protein n=1 Tax=Streptomyces griseoaurantiacus TaxID=68213 RepID=UPI00367905E9